MRVEAEALGWGHVPNSEGAYQQLALVQRLGGQFNLASMRNTIAVGEKRPGRVWQTEPFVSE